MSNLVFIGVGSNVGDRALNMDRALGLVAQAKGVRFVRSAPVYETAPVGGPEQGNFLNTVWEIETELSAEALLKELLAIETKLGRMRTVKDGPRTIDLDILFYDDSIIKKPGLTIPHPRLQERWFVLKPLWDLRADFIHPILKKSVCEMLDEVSKKT